MWIRILTFELGLQLEGRVKFLQPESKDGGQLDGGNSTGRNTSVECHGVFMIEVLR